MQLLNGFKQFVLKGNVVDLAVAVVVGSAFNNVVQSFVKDLLTPLIAAIGGEPAFSNLFFTIHNSKFQYGEFINALITFVINAAVIYFFVVVPINQLISLARLQKPADPTTKKCPFCQSDISIKATKCAFCTSNIAKVSSHRTAKVIKK